MGRPEAAKQNQKNYQQQPREYHFQGVSDQSPPFETDNQDENEGNERRPSVRSSRPNQNVSTPPPSRGAKAQSSEANAPHHQPRAVLHDQFQHQMRSPIVTSNNDSAPNPQAFPPQSETEPQAFPPQSETEPQSFPPQSETEPQAFPPGEDFFPEHSDHQAFQDDHHQVPQPFPPQQGQPDDQLVHAFPPNNTFQIRPNVVSHPVAIFIPPNIISQHPNPTVAISNNISGIPNQNPWKTGLFECMNDPGNALVTACFPCVTFGQIAEVVDSGHSSCGSSGMLYGTIACCIAIPCVYSCTYRTKLRSRFGLTESHAPDWIIHCFCECCALCQEYRELQLRGLDPSIGWQGNVARAQNSVHLASMTPPMRQTMMG